MTGIIYHAYDTLTGKSYVGQTWGTLEKRRKGHMNKNSDCRVFRDVLQTRSADFTWTVIARINTQSEMNEAELYWADYFGSVWPEGFNLRVGHSRGRMSADSKKKMSQARKGKPLSQEHRLAISRGSVGKKMSLAAREKVRKANLGKKRPGQGPVGRVMSREEIARRSMSQKLRRLHECEVL